MGDPGGGSDFAGFYNHLGMPIAEWGFGGPGGVYHSQYDDFAWMSRFGDSSFAYHAAAARIAAGMLLRFANADILPYDYVEYARTVRRYVSQIESAVIDRHWSAPTTSLRASIWLQPSTSSMRRRVASPTRIPMGCALRVPA